MFAGLFFVSKIIFTFSTGSGGAEIYNGPRLGYDKLDPSNESAWEAAQCLRRFLIRFSRKVQEAPFYLATKNVTSSEADLIFRTILGGEMPTYLRSGNISYGATYSSSESAIILSDDLDVLMQDSQPHLSLLCSNQCLTYLVILTHEYKSEEKFSKDIEKLVQFLWKKRIGNIVVTAMIEKNFVFGKSQNFKTQEPCKPENPKIVGICSNNRTENVKLSRILFSSIKANNCSIKASHLPRPPYVIMGKLGSMSGVEGELMKAISHFVPFKFKSGVIFKTDYSSLYILPKKILAENNNLFFVFGGMPSIRQDDIDYTVPYDVSQLIWILPLQSHVSLSALTNPLEPSVWIILLFMLSICLIMAPFLFPKFNGLLEMMGLLLGVSLPEVPSSFAHKTFFITWAMMSYVIAQFYLASLAKNLLLGSTARISNVEELLKSELKLVADGELNWAYADSEISSEYKYDHIVRERLVYKSKTEIEKIQDDLLIGKLQDTAILTARNFSSAKFDLGDHAYQLPEIVRSYPIAIATWKGMPILKAMNEAIQTLIETGHVVHWASIFSKMNKVYKKNDREMNVGLTELFPAFILMFGGYICSVIVFLMEVLYYKFGNIKKNVFKKRT